MITLAALAGAVVVMLVWLARRPRAEAALASSPLAGVKMTPLSVVTSLRRLRAARSAATNSELDRDIAGLELKYFGPEAPGAGVDVIELRAVVERWSKQSA